MYSRSSCTKNILINVFFFIVPTDDKQNNEWSILLKTVIVRFIGCGYFNLSRIYKI